MSLKMVPRKSVRTDMFLGDRWVTIADDVRHEQGYGITYGSSAQDRSVPPAKLRAVLANESERYSRRNPLSPNYGKLGDNTPTRLLCGITADTFGRAESNGWGLSPYGDVWTIESTAANYSVSAGSASMTVPSAVNFRSAVLTAQLHKNVEVGVTVTLPFSNVTGGSIEPANIMLRWVSSTDYLMARVVITSAEVVTVQIMNRNGDTYGSLVTLPFTFAGQPLRVAAQVEGSVMRVKVWELDTTVPGSDGEPLDWSVEATVPDTYRRAGAVGVRSGVGSGNTNVPVTFSYSDFTVCSNRFYGEAATMVPSWNLAETVRSVTLDTAGLLQRLQQGSRPIQSTLRRSIPSLPDLVAYWPMEDGTDATSLASGFGGLPMTMDPNGEQDPSSYSEFPGSIAIPTLGSGMWSGTVPDYASTGEVQLRYLVHTPEGVSLDQRIISSLTLKGGTLTRIDVRGGPTVGQIRLVGYSGATTVLDAVIGFDIDGLNVRMSLELQQDGSDVDWGLWVLEVGATSGGGATGTLTGHTLGTADRVEFSLYTDLEGTALGHSTVESQVTSLFDLASQLNAYAGETATDRLTRLCREEGVTLSLSGASDPDAKMGYQRASTLMDLLKECADLDMGILGESRGRIGLKYRTRLSMLNQAISASIDRAAGQLSDPFRPVDDNRLTANDVTAERVGGSSHRAEQLTGPMSVQDPPDGAGRIPATPKFVAFSDTQLPDLAGWRLALGTIDDYRYPSVSADMAVLDVENDTELVAGLLSLDIGDVIEVAGLASLGIYDNVLQVVHGYTETIYPHRHVIQANTFPASPYAALVLDDDALGKADSGSSTVSAGFSDTAGSFSVATADADDLWTTDAAEFPFDVMVGGERIRLSAISGASSPQTFTVAAGGRSLNGVVKSHDAGESVHIATPVRLA